MRSYLLPLPRLRSKPSAVWILAMFVFCAVFMRAYSMEKIHFGLPEPILFLELAVEAMDEYHQKTGKYPKEWYLLDFAFANGPYRIDDPDVKPTKSLGNKWQPKDCKYVYEIASATQDSFLIQAIDEDGLAKYEIEQGMETPRKLNAEAITPH
jgi:hypothetical protein